MQPHPPTPAVTIDSLLAHADWVRALAKRLVADPNTAEDLEQEVWRTALESPPRDSSNPRGWLASVARNAARSLGRSSSRRKQRERASARPEALPPTSELVAEAELARELAGEVLALEEPYRTVLLLRYWRALSPDEIARSQSVPLETVRTQLRRGLERLRERLDRRYGDREAWLAALAPLARETALPLSSAAAGGLIALLLEFSAAAALAAVVWLAWPKAGSDESGVVDFQDAPKARAAALEADEGARSTLQPASRPSARTEVTAARQGMDRGGAAHRLAGRVIGLDGKPLADLELEWKRTGDERAPHWEGSKLVLRRTEVDIPPRFLELMRAHPEEIDKCIAEIGDEPGFREALLGIAPQRFLARTRGDGGFEVSLGEGDFTIEPTHEHRMVVAELSHAGKGDWTLIVAPCVKLSGVVVDEAGVPVPDASFSYMFLLDRLEGLPQDQPSSSYSSLFLPSGRDGRFELPRMPFGPGLSIEVQAEGFETRGIGPFEQDEPDLRIELAHPPRLERPELSGLVLDQQGAPVAAAWVSLGQDGAATDPNGRFAFQLSIGHPGEPLTATKQGFQAAVLAEFGQQTMQSQSEILLRLGPPALSIEGRVLLPDGSSPGRCHVQVIDGTQHGSNACTIEDVSAGHYQSGVDTDERGRFVLGGLRSREYRLLAHSPQRGQIALSAPIAAGTKDVLLQDAPTAFFPHLAGRLVTRHGAPLVDAEVYLSIPTFVGQHMTQSANFGSVRTDELGRFELHDVPRQWCRLGIAGWSVKMEDHPVPVSAEPELVLVAALEVRTRIEVADERIDTIAFLDAQGAECHGWVELPDSLSARSEVARLEGKFPVVRLGDAVENLILKQGKTEIRRVPVEIRREKLLTLRF